MSCGRAYCLLPTCVLADPPTFKTRTEFLLEFLHGSYLRSYRSAYVEGEARAGRGGAASGVGSSLRHLPSGGGGQLEDLMAPLMNTPVGQWLKGI